MKKIQTYITPNIRYCSLYVEFGLLAVSAGEFNPVEGEEYDDDSD